MRSRSSHHSSQGKEQQENEDGLSRFTGGRSSLDTRPGIHPALWKYLTIRYNEYQMAPDEHSKLKAQDGQATRMYFSIQSLSLLPGSVSQIPTCTRYLTVKLIAMSMVGGDAPPRTMDIKKRMSSRSELFMLL
ncbi:hypothetical protein E2C01_069252 [Portunus trituberculatus]|uniref:Uncharacterized protein n=1 Tax=Portunus trituberculatus TaxID=210409 RepID=A0A5B7I2A7_PORTR|nr:hypothetical protein [Portunus trituberculatus]